MPATPEAEPPAPPKPSPPPTLRPRPPAPVALPHYRRTAARAKPKSAPNVLTTTLLVTAPAVIATAILRPRSR
ncbi:hypothetical protein ACFU3J_07195 [Streptomyces sp. NPDC057411]|uniref:hypothetical protein n=1 Tax=unclassified Streptomyces TaxID=2593676 RepID=UPI003638DB3F